MPGAHTIQLPPIPASILGISNIMVENAEITKNNEFIITVISTEKEMIDATKALTIASKKEILSSNLEAKN